MRPFELFCDPARGILTIVSGDESATVDYSNYEPIDNIEDLVRGLSECIKDFLTN